MFGHAYTSFNSQIVIMVQVFYQVNSSCSNIHIVSSILQQLLLQNIYSIVSSKQIFFTAFDTVSPRNTTLHLSHKKTGYPEFYSLFPHRPSAITVRPSYVKLSALPSMRICLSFFTCVKRDHNFVFGIIVFRYLHK